LTTDPDRPSAVWIESPLLFGLLDLGQFLFQGLDPLGQIFKAQYES
jgi:hypothetical protein